jgi:glycosyltransferase involved in cell wall biosynthesis
LIVVDASAVPDFHSGARTRLRGLYGAYAQLTDAPPLAILVARGSKLFDGVKLGPIRVEEVARPGGPWRRAVKHTLKHTLNWSVLGRGVATLLRETSLWHSETIPPLGPKWVGAAPSATKLPTFLTIHDVRWAEPRAATGESWSCWWPRHAAARAWLPRLARSLTGIVTVSNWSAQRVETLLQVPRDRVHVVANATAVDCAPRLAPDDEQRLLEELGVASVPFLLCVGHLEPRKGLDLALEAFAAFAKSRAGADRSPVKLVLVGRLGRDGESRGARELRHLAARLAVADHVVFAGELSERATSSLYALAAALLFPSRYEGFGLPVFEARSFGCPVIARKLEVLEESRVDGVTRLGGATSEWAQAIAAARRSPRPAVLHSARDARDAPDRGRTWSESSRDLAALYRSVDGAN